MKSIIESGVYLLLMAWITVISVQFIVMNQKVTKVNEVSTHIENFIEAKGEGLTANPNTNTYYPTYTYKSVVKVGTTDRQDADGNTITTYTLRDEETKKQFIYEDDKKETVIFKVADVKSDGTVDSNNYQNISTEDANYKYILDYKDVSKYDIWYTATDTETNMPYTCIFKKDSEGKSRTEEVPISITAKDFNNNKKIVSDFNYTRMYIHYTDEFKAQLDGLIKTYDKQGFDISFNYYDTTNNYVYISYNIKYKLSSGFFGFSTNHNFNGVARFPITGVVGSY